MHISSASGQAPLTGCWVARCAPWLPAQPSVQVVRRRSHGAQKLCRCGHSFCLLPTWSMQVVCDGCPVALPADIEGLLVCNINSYM